MRGKGGLVLTAQQGCGLRGKTTQHNISGINDEPLTVCIARLWAIGTHGTAFTFTLNGYSPQWGKG